MTGLWILMLVTDLLIPLTMIGFGKKFRRGAPEKVNPFFGYRTQMSMKNAETWAFAHHYFGNMWYKIGVLLLPVSVIPIAAIRGSSADMVALVGTLVCCVQCIPMLVPIIPTERALRAKFDDEGNPVGM